MPSPIDELDRQLLDLLLSNPDMGNKELAVQLNSSESTIRRRKQALVDAGVIRFAVVTDPFQLGYSIMALIGLQIDMGQADAIEVALSRLPQLRFIGLTIGRYDVLTEAWFKSNQEMLTFVTNILGRIPGIQRSETLQVLKLVKYGYDWGQTSRDVKANVDQQTHPELLHPR
jgi:Lrp/AsnC family transcriptional regulator for asnA, asnC and gidA